MADQMVGWSGGNQVTLVRRLGFTILEMLVASCIASMLLVIIFHCHLKLSHVISVHRTVSKYQQQQFWAYHYFWRQLIHAGFAGRCNLRQLDISADGEEVWRNGIYGFDSDQRPSFWVHKGALSDVLQLAYATEHWAGLLQDLNPRVRGQVIKLPKTVFSDRVSHYVLIDDDERSEAVVVARDGLHVDGCRYLHHRVTARLYPLQRVSFFVGYNNSSGNDKSGCETSLYRVVCYGRKEELLRGVSGMHCWFGVAAGDSSKVISYFKASEVTARALWSSVVAVKVELVWSGYDVPLVLVARLRNLSQLN